MKTNLKSEIDFQRRGFTLIELLVVISIIAVLAALIIPVAGSVARSRKIGVVKAEMETIKTALENYKAKYGIYPPAAANAVTNQLFYELTGTTVNNANFVTLDGVYFIPTNNVSSLFGVGGFINCAKGSGEDAVSARNFLPGLKATQVATNTVGIAYLVTSVGGPDSIPQQYEPLVNVVGNPFRYLYPGTNNPGSYDLWVDLRFSGKINRVSNWSAQTQIIK